MKNQERSGRKGPSTCIYTDHLSTFYQKQSGRGSANFATPREEESSPICKFWDSNEDETPEHIYWKCKKWAEIREKFPLARKVFEETQHTVTKACGLVLRSEDDSHSQAKVVQMQWMMATILKSRHAAGKQDAIDNDPRTHAPGLVEAIRPHDLETLQTRDGRRIFLCRRCGAFRSHTTQTLASEHWYGRRRQHVRFPWRPACVGAWMRSFPEITLW